MIMSFRTNGEGCGCDLTASTVRAGIVCGGGCLERKTEGERDCAREMHPGSGMTEGWLNQIMFQTNDGQDVSSSDHGLSRASQSRHGVNHNPKLFPSNTKVIQTPVSLRIIKK